MQNGAVLNSSSEMALTCWLFSGKKATKNIIKLSVIGAQSSTFRCPLEKADMLNDTLVSESGSLWFLLQLFFLLRLLGFLFCSQPPLTALPLSPTIITSHLLSVEPCARVQISGDWCKYGPCYMQIEPKTDGIRSISIFQFWSSQHDFSPFF